MRSVFRRPVPEERAACGFRLRRMIVKKRGLLLLLLDYYIWLLVLFFFVVASLTIPRFFSINNMVNILYHSVSLGLMILGMSLCLLTGQTDLSVESTYAFAPALAVMLMNKWMPGFNPYLAILVTFAVGMLVGLVNGLIVVKLRINAFLVSLAMLIILRGIVLFWVPQGIYDVSPIYKFMGETMLDFGYFRLPISIFLLLAIYTLGNYAMNRTNYGMNVIATGSNPAAAYIAGINTNRVLISVFVLSGFFSALGGFLNIGRIGSVLNTMGNGDVMFVLAGATLGGISMSGGSGKIINALGGTLLLTIVATLLNLGGVNPFLVQAIQGGILLFAIILGNSRDYFYKLYMSRLDD